MLKLIIKLLFPITCTFCDSHGSAICDICKKAKFDFYSTQVCHVCKLKVSQGWVHDDCSQRSSLDGVIISVHYNHPAKVAIEELKYKFYYSIAKDIGQIMKEKLHKYDLDIESAIPVPLHWFKKNYRGFNQAELLAREIFGKEKVSDCIKRTKKTKTQVGMTRVERINNLKEVFEMKHSINYKKVILVDDVMTSGTTLEECAKLLKNSGVEEVYGIVFARD